MAPLIWQIIDSQERPTGPGAGMVYAVQTERARVLGGWLVRTMVLHREATLPAGGASDIETNLSVGLTFVPDPGTAWV